MATGNKKELIDDLASKLRDYELPYREGAWERFSTLQKRQKARVLWPYWSAAAVLLALGISYLALRDDASTVHPQVAQSDAAIRRSGVDVPSSDLLSPKGEDQSPSQNSNLSSSDEQSPEAKQSEKFINQKPFLANHVAVTASETSAHNLNIEGLVSKKVENLQAQMNIAAHPTNRDLLGYPMRSTIRSEEPEQKFTIATLGGSGLDQSLAMNNPVSSRGLGKKWELGAFVSPASSNDEMSMGGGLSVAYKLTNKLSVRSGVALQNYQMAMALDPTQKSPAMMDAPASGNAFLTDVSSFNARMNPNFTAVSGSVLTLDIPVEMKYSFTKTFYTSVGMSMVSVLQQERVNHYVENISANTFVEGKSAAGTNNIQAVNRTIKSDQENVKTDGFNGFINLSIGRKLPLKKTFSISVEPFYRVPLGQFRSADGNYSNGGIKVITNF